MIRSIRGKLANYVWMQVIRKHHSRMGRFLAPKYTEYLKIAQRAYRHNAACFGGAELSASSYIERGFSSYWDMESSALAKSMLQKLEREERELGVESTWDEQHRYANGDIFQKFPEVEALFKGQVGSMIKRVFRANFKIFYGIMYKSLRLRDVPQGSQLWHSDGGPGTCMNVMFCLNATDEHNGAMEFVPWDVSLSLFASERKYLEMLGLRGDRSQAQQRNHLCEYYYQRIEKEFLQQKVRLSGDSGLVIAFRNNGIHRGGYPDVGKVRFACVFHLYPSVEATPWEKYRNLGIGKTTGYPEDPAF